MTPDRSSSRVSTRVAAPGRRFRRRTTIQTDRPTFAPATGAGPVATNVTREIFHPLPAHVREMRLHLSLAKLALPVVAAFSLLMAAAVVFLPPGIKGETGEGHAQHPTAPRMVFPTVLQQRIARPMNGDWKEPSAAVVAGDRFYILDAGNGRILETDASGEVSRVFDGNTDPRLRDVRPAALATDGSQLYVAGFLAGQVFVVSPAAGRVVGAIAVPRDEADSEPPRPVGLAVGPNGNLYVSDGANRKLVVLTPDGSLVTTVRARDPESRGQGFAAPGAVTVDAAGNIYVVDIGDLRVIELAPDGSFVREFGRAKPGQPVLSRPKGIGVDANGNVFVSDALGANVKVYDRSGAYAGVIGREETGDWTAGTMLQAPAGVTVSGGRLIVTDRLAGLFVFELPPA